MTEISNLKPITWHNPLAPWGAENAELTSVQAPDASEVWDANTQYKAKTHKVGRLKHYMIWPNHGQAPWDRWRWWPTATRASC